MGEPFPQCWPSTTPATCSLQSTENHTTWAYLPAKVINCVNQWSATCVSWCWCWSNIQFYCQQRYSSPSLGKAPNELLCFVLFCFKFSKLRLICRVLGAAGTLRVTEQPVLPAACPRDQLSTGSRPCGEGGKALEILASPLPEEPVGT